jgi:hypothetical protein
MYLYFHNTRIYECGLKYSQIARYAFSLFFILASVTLWYFFIHTRLNHAIGAYDQRYMHLKEECTALSKEKMVLYKKQEAAALHKKKLRTIMSNFNKHVSLRNCLISLVNRLHEASLFLHDTGHVKEISKAWYKKTTMWYQFSGSFSQILAFFGTLNTDKSLLLQCKELSLEKMNEQTLKTMCSIDYIELKESLA